MARGRERIVNPGARAKPPDTERLTVDIPAGLGFRLAGLARLQGLDKRRFVAKLLEQGCGLYKADKALKSALADGRGEELPVGQEPRAKMTGS